MMEEAFGLLLLSMSPEFCLHVFKCSTPNEVWTALKNLFENQVEMLAHILENKINSLDPNNFGSNQNFFMKFKSLLLQLNDCVIYKSKQQGQLILYILSKLGLESIVYVTTFHTVRLTTRDK